MPHSYYNLWIHAIWSTKKREPLITEDIEKRAYQFISEQFQTMDCPAIIINGMPDHIHCLFRLNQNKSVAEVIKHIKGSSSFYINSNELIQEKFAWQTGYAVFSVSASVKNRVYQYIKNQKSHHQHKSFEEELKHFIKLNEKQG